MTNNINLNIYKRPFSNGKEPALKRRRIPAEKNLAPSVGFQKVTREHIKQHGYARSQLFFLSAALFYKKAECTGKPPLNVKVTIPGATMQVGQGDRDHHAAHPNASAGVSDNLKEAVIDYVSREGLTPKKRALLRAKKFTADDLEKLQKNLFNKCWPEASLIKGIDLEYNLNMTHVLPRALNLGCDLVLEKAIRPDMAISYEKLTKGELDPRKATLDFIKATRAHFNTRISVLKNKLQSSSLTKEERRKYENQLFFHQAEFDGTVEIDFATLSKGLTRDDNKEEIDVAKTFDLFK